MPTTRSRTPSAPPFAQQAGIGKAGAGNKPGSVEGNHSSGTAVTGRLEQPTRESARNRRLYSPIWSCSGRGLPCRGLLPAARCALTAPFHPYRASSPAVCFLWHFPWARALQALPGALSEGARTFLCLVTKQRLPGRLRRFRTADSKPFGTPGDGPRQKSLTICLSIVIMTI